MSKLYSREDINIDKRLGYCEDALNEVFERLAALERKTKLRLPKKPQKKVSK